MANPEHLAVLRKGVRAWNNWRAAGGIEVDLREADLQNAELDHADLTITDLRNANLAGAQLHEADLRESHICDADLRNANLRNAKLHRTDARRANLSGAALHRADLHQTNLNNANLRNASLYHTYIVETKLEETDFTRSSPGWTVFSAVDLSSIIGLETAFHSGPSSLGIDTVYLSNGLIPEEFLRGAGVPETLIVFAKSLVGKPIEFYSCFISYSSHDQNFADRLYADLQAKGVRCWFAPHDVQGGRKLHEQIDEAIRLHDKLLLILSPQSMSSEWVKTEISKARKREVRDHARVLFPISLVPFETIHEWEYFDTDTGKDSAREIREYFIPDFSCWKDHDAYQQALERLLSDLKASGEKPVGI